MFIFLFVCFVTTTTNNNTQVNNILDISTLLHIITHYYLLHIFTHYYLLLNCTFYSEGRLQSLFVCHIYLHVCKKIKQTILHHYIILLLCCIINIINSTLLNIHSVTDSETRRSKRSPCRCEVPPTFA